MGAGTLSPGGVVYVLVHDMDADPTPESVLREMLSDEELTRAERFATSLLGRRYRLGRALLRRVLASWVGRAPRELDFELGAQGKPWLPGGPAFNMSHSGGALLIGVTAEGRLGVDIECRRPIEDMESLAAQTLSPRESRALLALSPAERDTAFLRVWTRKEAFIKGLGGGLSIPLASFSVAVEARDGNALESVDDDSEAAERWQVRSVPVGEAWIAAVALDHPGFETVLMPSLPE